MDVVVSMGNSSCSKEMSDGGLKDYTDLHYKLFQFGDFKVRAENGEFQCPFCASADSHKAYTNLLLHSVRVAGDESMHNQKERAKHAAMARYLAFDLFDQIQIQSQQHLSRKRSRDKREKEAVERVEELETKMSEMQEEINALVASKKELQNGCKELIRVFNDKKKGKKKMNGDIGIKKIGELDPKLFTWKLGRLEGVKVCTMWQERIKDPHWYPFQIVMDGEGKPKRVLKEDDSTLQSLKGEWGDAIHDKVVEALTELLECNPSGCYPVPVLWNFGEGRKAALEEVIRHLFDPPSPTRKPPKRTAGKNLQR